MNKIRVQNGDKMPELLERELIKNILKHLDSPDILIIHGARQVGKTCIMKYIQNRLNEEGKNTLYIDLEDLRFLDIFNKGVHFIIKYLDEKGALGTDKLYLFVDEIQYLDNPSNVLKLIRDQYSHKIKLLVSGSSSFEIKSKFKDSLVGRTLNFEAYPLNFREFLFFKGYRYDLSKARGSGITTDELKEHYKEYMLYGGYPRIVLEKNISNKEIYLQQIIDTYIRKDIRDLAHIKDIGKFNKLLDILAAQCGQLVNILELSNTAKLSRQTVEDYLFIMENTYIIKLLKPFSKNVRSELFKMPKVFFYDTGIASLLWLKAFSKEIIGNMFEVSVFSEIIKGKNKEEVFFWRTQDKKEVDFIIRRGRNLIPVEAKLSSRSLNLTALNYFKENYKTKRNLCISLDINHPAGQGVTFRYPWQLFDALTEKSTLSSTLKNR